LDSDQNLLEDMALLSCELGDASWVSERGLEGLQEFRVFQDTNHGHPDGEDTGPCPMLNDKCTMINDK
jgi:hypothetical protein